MAPIRPLAWELPYATCADLKRKKKKKNERLLLPNLIASNTRGWWDDAEMALASTSVLGVE